MIVRLVTFALPPLRREQAVVSASVSSEVD
jgi:hypothetical protein